MFEDETGVSLLPSVRATWAPRGQTPVLRHHFAWKRLSIAGVLAYEPDGGDAHLVFQLRPGAYNDETLIDFLAEVHRYEERRSVILIWDGLPSHRSQRMMEWVANQRHWLSVEPLPGYAPDLNPLEQAWGNVKSQELANLCADTMARYRKPLKTGWTASTATPHFASPSSVTRVCDYDHSTAGNCTRVFRYVGVLYVPLDPHPHSGQQAARVRDAGREVGRAAPLAHDVVVRVVEPERRLPARPQRVPQRPREPAMILDVVQHEVARHGVEAAG